MILFDLFDNIIDTIREQNERRHMIEVYKEEARKYIQKGKELNKEADVIYLCLSETKCKLEEHYDYKKKVVLEFSSNISPVLLKFENFNIDTKIIIPSVIDDPISNINLFKGTVSSIIPSYNYLYVMNVNEEYYEARRKRDEAKKYYEDVKYQIERLKNVELNMKTICNFIESEKVIIENMVSKLKNISEELKFAMKKDTFSSKEAEHLKGLYRIAMGVNKLISTKFLNDDLTITNQYKIEFNKIKQIHSYLMEIPSVSDECNFLKEFGKLINIVVF